MGRMRPAVRAVLACPACHQKLDWVAPERPRCSGCGTVFEVRDGIAAFLLGAGAAAPEASWEQTQSGLRRYLQDKPERMHALLGDPADQLNPADLFFRGLLLEEDGRFAAAELSLGSAVRRSYRPEYLDASRAQLTYLISALDPGELTVDIASGRGTLIKALLDKPPAEIVASDLSPLVLRRMRDSLAVHGAEGPLSYLAFDAGAIPFADQSIPTAVTHLGLPNLTEPERALGELRRVVRGRLAAVSYFMADDDPNRAVADELGFGPMLRRAECVSMFERAGWSVTIENPIVAPAAPTPRGEIVEGATLDTFPAVPTELTWCVLMAR
jgi:ubiquinone/menaquinone biosynthesis C-methylase UbiE/uncharacterized protein YbaR (Trm112 family)